MTAYVTGDRVQYDEDAGTVDKYIPAQGSFVSVCVVDWDGGSRSTVWASDLVREEENK